MKKIYFYPLNLNVFHLHYNCLSDPAFRMEFEKNNLEIVEFTNDSRISSNDILIIIEAKNLKPSFLIYWNFTIIDKVVFIINAILNKLKIPPKFPIDVPKILITFESELHAPENHFLALRDYCDTVFTWNDKLSKHVGFRKFLIPQQYHWPKIQNVKFEDKKLLVNISANKYFYRKGEFYSKRRDTIKLAERNLGEDFELYGIDWNKPVTLLQNFFNFLVPHYSSYKGIVKDKSLVFPKFKFALIYENSSVPGYITEKVFDCLRSNCVPVYLGAPNISEYLPNSVYIDRRQFNDDLDLFNYLISINEARYALYIRDINYYLNSENFSAHLSSNFATNLISVIKDK